VNYYILDTLLVYISCGGLFTRGDHMITGVTVQTIFRNTMTN